jgi:hypothetical protein
MAVRAKQHDASQVREELSAAEQAEPHRVAEQALDQHSPPPAHAEPTEPRSIGIRELMLGLCIGLPQLAWMGLLMYFALQVLS